jgi:hypothetical protein
MPSKKKRWATMTGCDWGIIKDHETRNGLAPSIMDDTVQPQSRLALDRTCEQAAMEHMEIMQSVCVPTAMA